MTDQISAIVANSLEVKRLFFDAHAGDVERAAQIIAGAFKATENSSYLAMVVRRPMLNTSPES
jgi:hypothetical protein